MMPRFDTRDLTTVNVAVLEKTTFQAEYQRALMILLQEI
jgi:hypothetical protein